MEFIRVLRNACGAAGISAGKIRSGISTERRAGARGSLRTYPWRADRARTLRGAAAILSPGHWNPLDNRPLVWNFFGLVTKKGAHITLARARSQLASGDSTGFRPPRPYTKHRLAAATSSCRTCSRPYARRRNGSGRRCQVRVASAHRRRAAGARSPAPPERREFESGRTALEATQASPLSHKTNRVTSGLNLIRENKNSDKSRVIISIYNVGNAVLWTNTF